MFPNRDLLLLCNFDEEFFQHDDVNLSKLWSKKWALENSDLIKGLLSQDISSKAVTELIVQDPSNQEKESLLCTAIQCLLTFCEHNWSPNPEPMQLEAFLGVKWNANVDVSGRLQVDSEDISLNVKFPELLFLSMQVLKSLLDNTSSLLHLWWYFRCKITHQKVLDDTSPTLFSELEMLVAKLSNEANHLTENPRLQVLLYAEISQCYLMYGRVQKAEEYLKKAKDVAGLKLELRGILGKRTKFQQDALAQLALHSELDADSSRPTAQESHGSSELPAQIELQDDVRLDKIEYSESIGQVELPSLEQTLCLINVQYLQRAQPKDNLADEELYPYIDAVLSQKNSAWSTRVAALLVKCKLESNHKRTVERAMMQCEAIVNDKANENSMMRLSYLWASGLQPCWCWRQQLADLYLSLGLVKAALEEYLKLQLWEDVIVCYTVLQLRHKAAEIIQQQIDIKPTVKLYCLLGDATDDITCYEKAWNFSNHKSSRAQRHWGNYLFSRSKYEECIPHFEKSVEINSLQERVWLRLGYAALITESWELAATAYRRYTYLQPNTFEAWNNLAKVYVKQGDKNRAYRALIEALKYNYDNWKLWENVVAVSADTRHFDDVIRGCHRILDLTSKFEDVDVLAVLVTSMVQDMADAEGNLASRLQKRVCELFGRITSVHPNKAEIWRLYADASPTYLLKGQRLLKAYSGFTQSGNWSSNPETCKKVIRLAQDLVHNSMKAKAEAKDCEKAQIDQQISSARLTAQAVIRAVEKQGWEQVTDELQSLKGIYQELMETLK